MNADATPFTDRAAAPSDATTALPPGHLACMACGVAVAAEAAEPPQVFVSLAVEGESPVAHARRVGGRAPGASVETELTRCPACRERHDQAADVVAARPEVFGRIGSPSVAAHRLARAADALAAVGYSTEELVRADAPAGVLHSLLRHLTGPGADALWAARFVPVRERDADPRTCAPTPWSAASVDALSAVRSGYAAVLAEQVAQRRPPVEVTPPDGRACVMCGIGAVRLSAVAVVRRGGLADATFDTWAPFDADAAALGGRRGAGRVSGYTCPACSAARDYVGAVGPGLLERAVAVYLTEQGDTEGAWRVREGRYRLKAWATAHRSSGGSSRPGAANRQPWAHLSIVDKHDM